MSKFAKTAKTASIPTTNHDGSKMRAYRLPDGSWYDDVERMLHVPVQERPEIVDAIIQALDGHDLQDTITQEIMERLETYELCKYMTGRRS